MWEGSCVASSWDGQLKRLVGEAPQDFISWLIGGAQFESELSPHLQSRNVDADILYRVMINQQQALLHIEFQKRHEPDMAMRLWKYNVLATCEFSLPVYSFVIYLKKDHKMAESPYVWKWQSGQEIHRFNFGVIKLWEISTEALKQLGLKGLLPLLPLTHEGNAKEVVEEVIAGLCPVGEKPMKELLSLAYGLAALIFNNTADHAWLRKKFSMLEDVLKDSWALQEIMQKGLEQGLEQGLGEGLRQEVQRHRQILTTIVESRFPTLVQVTKERCQAIDNPERLQDLIIRAGVAQNEQDFRAYLLEISRQQP